MYDDVYDVAKDLRHELMLEFEDSIKVAMEVSGDTKEKMEGFIKEVWDETKEEILSLMIDSYTTEELHKILEWSRSDVGKKSKVVNSKVSHILFSRVDELIDQEHLNFNLTETQEEDTNEFAKMAQSLLDSITEVDDKGVSMNTLHDVYETQPVHMPAISVDLTEKVNEVLDSMEGIGENELDEWSTKRKEGE